MTDFLSQENNTNVIMESNFLHQQKNIGESKSKSGLTESEKSPVRKREYKMTEQEKEENRKILKSMNRKLNFTRNPRFRNQNKCLLYSNALFQEILNKENPFVVEPMIIIFREYLLNCVYQIDLKLTNRKQILTSFKYIPPSTENFSVKKIIYPKKDTSLIAPGMHAKIEILFNATSLDSFEDEISIITEFFAFKVPLRAIREKPSLSLENPMNCGKCLIGDQTSMVFRCRNNGGDAHFKFVVDESLEYNKSPNNSVYNGTNYTVDNEVLVTGPFSIFPQEFYLYKGMSVEIYVNFSPQSEGLIEKDLFICCDSKINIPHKLTGEGIGVDFKILAIDDLLADQTFEKLENIFFEDTYPSTIVSRKLRIKNLSEFQLKYHWNIYDMYESNKNFLDDNESYFSISPENGYFEPLQELIFTINFQPRNCKNYEQKLDLIIEEIPFQSIKNFKVNNFNNFDNFNKNSNIKLAKNTFTKGEPFMLALNSPYPSFPFFSFNLIGKGKQCEMEVDSKIIDLGKVYFGEKIKKNFNLYNTKSGVLKFKISKILQGMKTTLLENSKFRNKEIIGYCNEIMKSTNSYSTFNRQNKNINKYGYDNSILVNNYFKWTKPGMTFTDHFRTESVFKIKKPTNSNINEIFDKFKKEKDYFKDKEDDIVVDVNKSILINDDLENYNKKKNENNNVKSINTHYDYFKNTKTEIDNNFLNYSNLKNCKFLKLMTSKENFTNKIIIRENSKSLKYIPTKVSFNNTKYLNKNIKIRDTNSNNNVLINSNENTNNTSNNQDKKNNVVIKRPESNVTCLSTNFANKNNNKARSQITALEPISENIKDINKINNDNTKLVDVKKSAYLLNKPLTKSLQLKKPGNYVINSNSLATSQSKETKSQKKNILKPLSSNNQTQQLLKQVESNNLNKGVNLKTSNLSKSTNSNIFKNFGSTSNEEDNDEIEINESDELVISKDQTFSINILFQPFKLGLFKCSCIIKAEDGIPFSVDLTANVIGPQIVSDIPAIDFGLFSISEIRTIKFKLLNISRAPARYLIKESRYKIINFENYLESDYLNDLQGIILEKKTKKKIENLNEFKNEHLRVMNIEILDNYEMKFSPICGVIRENSEVEITASFVSAYPKYYNDQIEVLVQNSESLFINVHADCQEAVAYIDKIHINPLNIFVSVPISFENNTIRIVNPSNLQINFEWDNINNLDEKIIEFYPRKGVVKPRSYVEISYSMTYFMIKSLDEIYICKIEQMDVPLGINIKGKVTGLDIIYEYTDEAFNQMHLLGKLETASIHSSITSNSLIRKSLSMKSNNRFIKSGTIKLDKTLKIIDLKNLKVNKHYSFQFVLKNLSGISTNFCFGSRNFSPGVEKDLKFEMLSKSSQMNLDNNIISNTSDFLIEKNHSSNSHNSLIHNFQNNSNINTFNGSMNLNNENKSTQFIKSMGKKNLNVFNNDRYNMSINNENNFNSKINFNISENNNFSKNSSINNINFKTNLNHLNSSGLKPIKTLNSLRYSQLAEKGIFSSNSSNIDEPIGHILLNDQHENLIFTSPKGIEHTKMKQVEKESHMYLSNKKGVALVIEPKQGKLEPYSEILINITVYNECVGDFEDELISQIKGLPEKRFPVLLKIRGNPLQLAPFQTGFDYNEEPPLLKMGNVITKINQINKTFKVINTGANLIMLDWKIFDYNKIIEPDPYRELIKLKICENKGAFSLKYLPCPPEEFNQEDKTYTVEPKNYLIQPKSIKEFNISFRANQAGLKSALLVAYPKFMDNNSSSNVGLSELAIKINSFGITPNLLVDKTLHFTGKYIYRFYLHSFGISQKPKKSIVLINKEKINFIIKLILEGPFKIAKSEPLESSMGNFVYNIFPKQNLKIEIKAISPDPKNYEDWPINLINEKHGKLICVFENGEIQEYYLTTLLKRPRLSISVTGNDAIESNNFIDFAYVNCESFKKSVLYIKNETDVYSDWSINYHKFVPKKYYGYGTTTKGEKEDIDMNDDPDVFLFSVTSGVIPGPSLPLINIPLGPCLPRVDNLERDKLLPVKVEIMFKPKKNVFYKCRYKIITSTGNNIDFILKGFGSYNEEEII